MWSKSQLDKRQADNKIKLCAFFSSSALFGCKYRKENRVESRIFRTFQLFVLHIILFIVNSFYLPKERFLAISFGNICNERKIIVTLRRKLKNYTIT